MGYTDPGDAVTGAIAPAALWNTGVRDNMRTAIPHLLHAYKASDESVTSSAVLQDDNDLFFAVAANEIWTARFTVIVVSSATDFDWTLTWPAGATGSFSSLSVNPGDLTTQTRRRHLVTSGSTISVDMSTSAAEVLEVYGVLVNSSTAGSLQFRWAQTVSNATATTVKAGSHVMGCRLSP